MRYDENEDISFRRRRCCKVAGTMAVSSLSSPIGAHGPVEEFTLLSGFASFRGMPCAAKILKIGLQIKI